MDVLKHTCLVFMYVCVSMSLHVFVVELGVMCHALLCCAILCFAGLPPSHPSLF